MKQPKVKTSIYARIVGYYHEISVWNPGQKEKMKDRNFSPLKSIVQK